VPVESLYDRSVIRQILPHRSPFLFVDRVMRFEPNAQIIAEWDVSGDEPFFAGHFPGEPIIPGVLLTEALAQASGLLQGLTWKETLDKHTRASPPRFVLASVNMKFPSPAGPGRTIRLESLLKKHYGGLFLFQATASTGSDRLASGTLSLAETGNPPNRNATLEA